MVSAKTSSTLKRKSSSAADSPDREVSPPPIKRQFQSTTTKDSVASFFKPVSQKGPDRTTWRDVNQSVLVANYKPESKSPAVKRRRIAAFDLDSTLIAPRSGNKFAKDEYDWKWWHPTVPSRLKELNDDGYQLVLFSNQSGLNLDSDSKSSKMDHKRVMTFKTKVNTVFSQLNLPIALYAATKQDSYRKPRTGMWKEMIEDSDLDVEEGIDLKQSTFVGDAGGRQAGPNSKIGKDHASSDRDFAANVGIVFQTPENFFLHEKEREFIRTFDPQQYLDVTNQKAQSFLRTNEVDIVVMCGSPGSGKSTFYWTHLAPQQYERVNQDILKTRDRCLDKAAEFLSNGKSVTIDNTNADAATRAVWVELGKKYKVPVRCIWLRADTSLCEHNDKVRALNGALMNPEKRDMLSKMAFNGFKSRFREPKLEEGLQDITVVDFQFQGTEEQREIWSKYWI